MNPAVSEFWRLFEDHVRVFRDPQNLGRESHDTLTHILMHLKRHSSCRSDFAACFVALVEGLKDAHSHATYGWKVIPFCMRELQWPEVKEAIERELGKTEDPELIHHLKRIRSSFETFWQDETAFLYYLEKSKREERK